MVKYTGVWYYVYILDLVRFVVCGLSYAVCLLVVSTAYRSQDCVIIKYSNNKNISTQTVRYYVQVEIIPLHLASIL